MTTIPRMKSVPPVAIEAVDRALGELARAGLLERKPNGAYSVVRTDPPPAPTPKPEPMGTLVVRVPNEWLEMLDAMGPDRSTALRTVLGRALAARSGTRAKVVDHRGRVHGDDGRYIPQGRTGGET